MKIYSMIFGSGGNPSGFSGLSPTMLIFYNLATSATVSPPAISESPAGWGVYTFSYGTTQPIWFLADAATTSPGTSGRYVFGVIDPADRIDEYGNTLVAIGTTNVALGTTNVALGTSSVALGTSNVALGTSIYALQQVDSSTLTAVGAIGITTYAYVQNLGITVVAIGNTAIAIGLSTLANTSYAATLSVVVGTTASVIGDNVTDPGDIFGYVKRLGELIQGQETFTKASGALSMFDRSGATTLVTRTITNSASLVVKS